MRPLENYDLRTLTKRCFVLNLLLGQMPLYSSDSMSACILNVKSYSENGK